MDTRTACQMSDLSHEREVGSNVGRMVDVEWPTVLAMDWQCALGLDTVTNNDNDIIGGICLGWKWGIRKEFVSLRAMIDAQMAMRQYVRR